MDVPVDLIAPGQGLSVQICQAAVLDSHHEIVPHKLHRPIRLPLRLAPVRLAQDGLEPVESREVLKLPVQRGVHLLHVIVQDIPQSTETRPGGSR